MAKDSYINLEDPRGFVKQLQKLAAKMPRFVLQMMRHTAARAHELAIDNLRGKVLQKRSGNLMARTWSQTRVSGRGIVQSWLWTDVPYGPVHEYGGLKVYKIEPKGDTKALRFQWGGKMVFFKSVMHPPAKPRPWMKPAGEQAMKEAPDYMKRELWRGRW